MQSNVKVVVAEPDAVGGAGEVFTTQFAVVVLPREEAISTKFPNALISQQGLVAL